MKINKERSTQNVEFNMDVKRTTTRVKPPTFEDIMDKQPEIV